jgi:glycosyltransferase
MNENKIYKPTDNNLMLHTDVEAKLILGEHSKTAFDISIMIPTYHRVKLLKESVFSALNQKTNLNIEIVVVDNSTDAGAHEEMESFIKGLLPAPIKLYRNAKNIGMFGNWNRCVTLCNSPWLVILNDDDLLAPNFVEEMWKIKSEDTILYCLTKKFGGGYNPDNDRNAIRTIRRILFPHSIDQYLRPIITIPQDRALYCNPLPGTLGALIPKEIAINLGGFNEHLWPTADYDFIVRAIFHGIKVKRLNKFLASYRIEANESLKVETLEAFLYNDYIMKLDIINKLSTSNTHRKILKALAQYQARLTAHVAYPKINHSFNPERSLAVLNISQKKPLFKSNAFPLVALLWKLLWKPVKTNIYINPKTQISKYHD